MKKSKIIDLINEEIENRIRFTFKQELTDIEESLIFSLSVDILDIIEEEGMQPPANGFDGSEIIYEWEKEDEV